MEKRLETTVLEGSPVPDGDITVLWVQTPVDDVEEQVCEGEDDSGVWVYHIAVAHDEAELAF